MTSVGQALKKPHTGWVASYMTSLPELVLGTFPLLRLARRALGVHRDYGGGGGGCGKDSNGQNLWKWRLPED